MPNYDKKSTSVEGDGVTIELISTNLKKRVNGFCLDVKEKSNPDKVVLYKKFKTTGNFIAVKNIGSVSFNARKGITTAWIQPWWWTYYTNLSGNQSLFVSDPLDNAYKVGVEIMYSSYYDINYSIYYNESNARGTECYIGTLDGANHCYVGHAPSGTTAFMYPNNIGNFYYTRVSSGTTCPYPGSWYDGANCYVCNIPARENEATFTVYTYGFIWNNSWYIQPEFDL